MSQVVVLSNRIAAPNLFGQAFHSLQAVNPEMAALLKNVSYEAMIREAANAAYASMLQIPGVVKANAILDFAGNNQAGRQGPMEFVGILKNAEFSRGLGIYFAANGEISFVADSYGCHNAVQALINFFTDAFSAQVNKAALEFLGYQVGLEVQVNNGQPVFSVEGVAQ